MRYFFAFVAISADCDSFDGLSAGWSVESREEINRVHLDVAPIVAFAESPTSLGPVGPVFPQGPHQTHIITDLQRSGQQRWWILGIERPSSCSALHRLPVGWGGEHDLAPLRVPTHSSAAPAIDLYLDKQSASFVYIERRRGGVHFPDRVYGMHSRRYNLPIVIERH